MNPSQSPSRRRPKATVTLKDVARAAGVHPGTASRALNAATRGLVSEATVARVLECAERLGYVPNPVARSLKTNRSHIVGLLIPDLTNPLFPPIVRGIQDTLRAASYTALIANTDNDPDRERSDFETLLARQVDGFIAATARQDSGLLAEQEELGVPVVLINRRLEGSPIPAVVGDDRAGARLAVEHLAALGHRHIAHLAGPEQLSTGHNRRQGFVAAMRGCSLEPDPELILPGEAFVVSEGARLCHELLDRRPDVTAIVAGNDLMALGCYDAFAARGIECPRQISVVGFNDMPFAEWFNPPLSTVRIPHYTIGERAAELLLGLLTGPEDGAAAAGTVLLDPELIVRGSTAPPAAAGS